MGNLLSKAATAAINNGIVCTIFNEATVTISHSPFTASMPESSSKSAREAVPQDRQGNGEAIPKDDKTSDRQSTFQEIDRDLESQAECHYDSPRHMKKLSGASEQPMVFADQPTSPVQMPSPGPAARWLGSIPTTEDDSPRGRSRAPKATTALERMTGEHDVSNAMGYLMKKC